ncbi:MAG: DUF2628 domain-containing protein [Elusimicrobia bacterium]|nr:DUF2628 domain-containing protein [Elusimicrobiota bacterium]
MAGLGALKKKLLYVYEGPEAVIELESAAPLPPDRRGRWQAFLSGDGWGSRVSFNPVALVFGPLWYLINGIYLKPILLASVDVVLAVACSVLGLGSLGTLGALTLWVYPGLFGEWDRYLVMVHGESLWPELPYKVWGWPACGTVVFAVLLFFFYVTAGSALFFMSLLGGLPGPKP